jgi:lipopolysaccharide export system protein LptA
MADLNASRPVPAARGLTVALALQAALAMTGAAPAAAAPAKTQAIDIVAQSLDSSLDTVVFHKVRVTQGTMSISADQGQGTGRNNKVDFDDSVWVFRGNVKITLDQGLLSAEEARITFYKQQLQKAVASGNPAVFEDRVQKTGKEAHGRAETIEYDAARNVVTLLTNAWLSDGQREISGDSLKYNLLARSIVAEGAEPNSQHVHIVVPPPPPRP